MRVNAALTAADLVPAAARVLQVAGDKARRLEQSWDTSRGAPVFTVKGQYTARGWTEWTQGFQYGLAILAFDATNDADLLTLGRDNTLHRMAPHVSHVGVHDHGFNNLSTYGNLRRLVREQRIPHQDWELAFYEMAIKSSAAVQAARWSPTADGGGYIYSFNGPHSLFIDTLRSLRILGLAHQLGHVLMGENDRPVSLLHRLITHALTTARFNLYYGDGRDAYDTPALRGRTVHEAIFNRNDGNFRCPNSQQGFSPFTTWTRGLAWAILGFAEQLEFLRTVPASAFAAPGLPPKEQVLPLLENAARATADFYIQQGTAVDGIPYWDTGAPALHKLGDWQSRPADPYNDYEPVDSSAAAIAAQGLLRLGHYAPDRHAHYTAAGLTVTKTLFAVPYLAEQATHQGLLLHTVYHRPNGWDYVPPERKIPCGEASMWGDYHAAELALLLTRLADPKQRYYTFFDA